MKARRRVQGAGRLVQCTLPSEGARAAGFTKMALLQHKTSGDKLQPLPDLVGALLNREVVSAAFRERWFSPSSHSHSAPVYSVASSPDRKTLASGSGEITIRLWDLSIYIDFINQGKFTPLLFLFTRTCKEMGKYLKKLEECIGKDKAESDGN
jgi:hypothetical protein